MTRELRPTCPYCHAEAVLASSRRLWPSLQHVFSVWMCADHPRCDSYVRCHEGSTTPMGTLANAGLRRLRSKAHKLFDPLWEMPTYGVDRDTAYYVAGRVLGMQPLHIGLLDEAGCRRFIDHIQDIEDAMADHARAVACAHAPDEATLDVLHGCFWDDDSGISRPRVPAQVLRAIDDVFHTAVVQGLVRPVEDWITHEQWVDLTERGKRLLGLPTSEVVSH